MDFAASWSYLRIVLIDIVLAEDNAVVIAMAARTLPKRQKFQVMLFIPSPSTHDRVP